MLASPTALKDYLFTDPEAEYQSRHYGETDISRRELSAPAGAQYLRRSGDGSLNVRTNHRERFHTKTGPVEHPPAFPRPVIGADRQRWHPKRRPVGWIGGHASPVPIVPVHEIAFLDAAAFRTGHGRICAAYRLGIRGTHTPVHAERPQERQRERSRPVRVAPGHDTAMAAVTSFWC